MDDLPRLIAEAYRWQRRLGATSIATPYCGIVAAPQRPDVWDSNHADEVVAQTDADADAVFAAMDHHLSHTRWRVIHTDCFTPDSFRARLALEDFTERFVTIQMALQGELTLRGAPIQLRPVVDEVDWEMLLRLVLANHAEGRSSADLKLPPEFSRQMVATYRAKTGSYHFEVVIEDGAAIAYGGYAAAPNGVGMIEDLFTLPAARRRGVATGMIAALVDRLRAKGSRTIFLGALAAERPKRLYARLGFHPVTLASAWVREEPLVR